MFHPLKVVLLFFPRSHFLFLLSAAVILGMWSFGSGNPFLTDSTVSPRIRFQNVAMAAGLDFVLRNDAAGRKYQVETILGGVGVVDFDNDGWPDLFAANGASLPT